MKKCARWISIVCIVTAADLIGIAGPAAAQGAKKPDPCALLTRAEIKAAVGQEVSEGKPNLNANPVVGSTCQYVVGSYGTFSILIKTARPEENAGKVKAELKKGNITVTDAAGIGDQSFYSSMGYGMIQLNTFKGSYYLIITMLVPESTEAAQKTAAEKLMRLALTRI
jgi:hypothetical protein